MSSTTNRMWRMPGALAGADPPSPSYKGEWYLASSTLSLPSGVRRITTSARTPSSPFMRSTAAPSTDVSPSTSSPSAVKNAVAAGTSSTTMPMCSRRWTVMNGLPLAACIRRAEGTSASLVSWCRWPRTFAALHLLSGAGQRLSTSAQPPTAQRISPSSREAPGARPRRRATAIDAACDGCTWATNTSTPCPRSHATIPAVASRA
jgi:hypothetical protein